MADFKVAASIMSWHNPDYKTYEKLVLEKAWGLGFNITKLVPNPEGMLYCLQFPGVEEVWRFPANSAVMVDAFLEGVRCESTINNSLVPA